MADLNEIDDRFIPEQLRDVVVSGGNVPLDYVPSHLLGDLPPTEYVPEDVGFMDYLKSSAAGTAAGFTAPVRQFGTTLEVIEDMTGIPMPGTELGEISRNAQEFWHKRIGKSKTERILGQSFETIGTIASTAAVIAASGGTVGEGEGLLLALSAGAGIEKTAEARREGAPKLNALGAGFATMASEYLTEKIPLNVLQKPGLGFFTRLAGGVISDVPGEMLNTAVELSIIDKKILGRDHNLSWKEYFDILMETAAVSAVSTVGLTGASQVLNRGRLSEDDVNRYRSEILDAINGIKAPDPETAELINAPETEDGKNAKTEFPELDKQKAPISPESSLDSKSDTGTKEPAENIEPEPGKSVVDTIYDEQNAYKSEEAGIGRRAKKAKEAFVRSFIDVSGNIKKKLLSFGNDGKRVVMARDLIAGSSSKAIYEFNVARKEIYSGLNKNQKETLDKLLFSLRHLEIRKNKGADFKLPRDITEHDLQSFIDSIPLKLKDNLMLRVDKWSRAMEYVLNVQLKEGLITLDQLNDIRSHGKYYLPRQVLEYIDPLLQGIDKQGRKISVRDSGLKNLSEDGSDKLVEMDSELLMQQVLARTWTRVFRNRAALEMLRFARKQPNNGIVRESVPKRFTKDGKPVYQDARHNETKVSVMENGVRKELIMPNEIAQEWVKSDPILSATASNWISWLSGNKILKAMATGLNPEFAITNIPRDIAHIYLTTDEYSSILPVALLQIANDLKAVAKDAELKSGLYKIYIDNGGGMEYLSHQGRFRTRNALTKTHDAMTALEDVMGYMGERSEILTRLALMNRAMRNGKSAKEATWIARNYLDFSQGGSVAKAFDTMIPFFNAGIQGTRGIFRAAKNNPVKFGWKVTNIGTLAISLFMANLNNRDKETGKPIIDDVPEDIKVRNWVITTPLWYVDDDGTKKYYYIVVPKDQGQRVFASAFEALAKLNLGMKVDGDEISDALLDFMPILPSDSLPPTVDAMLGYMVNKDFWRREDIWRGAEVEPQAEFNKYTPTSYVKIGEKTGLSPERLKYAMEQYFTNGNVWTSLLGFGAKQVFDELDESDMNKVVQELFLRKPGVRRFLKSTRPETEQQKRIKESTVAANTERKNINDAFDSLTDRYFNNSTDLNEIRAFIKRQPEHEHKRLMNRLKRQRKLKDIPNKRYWLNMMDLPPEYRAVNYWNDWVQLDELGRKAMDTISLKVPGFRSSRFNKQFNKMNRGFSDVNINDTKE